MNIDKKTGEIKKVSYDFKPSESGNPIRETFKLDKKINKLVKTGEIDQDKVIQSYFDETNYKDIIRRAVGAPIEDFLEQDKNAQYADVSDFSDSIFDNLKQAVKGCYEYNEIIAQQKLLQEKIQEKATGDVAKNEKSEVIDNE